MEDLRTRIEKGFDLIPLSEFHHSTAEYIKDQTELADYVNNFMRKIVNGGRPSVVIIQELACSRNFQYKVTGYYGKPVKTPEIPIKTTK